MWTVDPAYEAVDIFIHLFNISVNQINLFSSCPIPVSSSDSFSALNVFRL